MNTKLIDRILRIAELVFAIASIIGLILFQQEVAWSGQIMMISLFTLALFYMASGMYSIPGVDLFNKQVNEDDINKKLLIIGPFITGAGYALLMIFILFKILQWDGYETMFIVGMIGSVIGTSAMLFGGIGDFRIILLRFIPILVVSLLVYFF